MLDRLRCLFTTHDWLEFVGADQRATRICRRCKKKQVKVIIEHWQ